jgi:hypothetical protein
MEQFYKSRKDAVESLPHLKPLLWGGFNPIQDRGYNYDSLKSIVAGYTHRLSVISGACLFPLFVAGGDSPQFNDTCLHSHFTILSDRYIDSEKYRAARNLSYGRFFIKRYNYELGGIDYMFSRHEEMKFDECFCRKGRKCRKKHQHREFYSALQAMYSEN